MAATKAHGDSRSGTVVWEEEENDLPCISFLTDHQTAAAWQQLKQDKSLQDSQLATFLLQCYEDTLLHPTVCPHCQSTLQRFCLRCSRLVDDEYEEPNQPASCTDLDHGDTLKGETTPNEAQKSHAVETSTSRPEADCNDITSAETGRARPSRRCKTERSYASVSSDSDEDLDLMDYADDDGSDMDEQPEPGKEDNDATDDNMEDYDQGRLELTGATDTGARINRAGSGAGMGTSAPVGHTVVTKTEKVVTHENERTPVSSSKESAGHNQNDEGSVQNVTRMDIRVKVETEDSDNEENTQHAASDSNKPDIVSCTWCDIPFKTIVALTKHLTEHTTQIWQRQNLLEAYHKTKNRRQSMKNAYKSGNMKSRARSMNRSQRNIKAGSDTVDCEESTEESSLGQKDYRCLQCGQVWKTPVGLTYHMQAAHIRKHTYQCLTCGITFRSLKSAAFHMRTHPVKREREQPDPTTHPHQCGQCGVRFMQAGSLAHHIERHVGPCLFCCSLCQQGFQSMTELTGHQCQPVDQRAQDSTQDRVSPQDQDSGPFQSGGAGAVPLSGSGEETAGEHKSGIDLFCQSLINTASEQLEHRESIFGNMPEGGHESKKPAKRGRKRKKSSLTMKNLERPHKCPQCPATFMHASVLKLHSQKHSGQKAFPCDQCDQSFLSKTKLFKHQEQDHWGSMPITCKLCGKVFTTVRSLDEHGVLHTGERPYECETCGEAFAYRTALTRHRRTHRPSYFKCKECGAEFHLKSMFKNHLDEHKTIKPHLCSHCGQSFSTLSMLKQHVEKHGQKQFVCELCGKAFRKRGDQKMHLLTHQEVKPFPCPLCDRSFVSRCKLQLHNQITHLHLKPFKCRQCDAGFTCATYLKDHIVLAHTTERPFACSLCPSRFAANRLLKLHLRRTHKKKSNALSSESELDMKGVSALSPVM